MEAERASGGAALADPPAPATEVEPETPDTPPAPSGMRVFFRSGNTADYTETMLELEDKLHQVYGTGDGVLLKLNPMTGGPTEFVNLASIERFKPILGE